MPKRPVIKIIVLSLITLGTVIICTAINRAESARLMAADSPGVPGSLLTAGFIVYPLLCALTGLVCGRDRRWLRFVPATAALAASFAMRELAMVLPYGAVGYLFFFIAGLIDKPPAAGKQSGATVKLSALIKDIYARLSKPSGVFALLTAYSLLAAALLCALDAAQLPEGENPLYFTSTLGLIIYPVLFIVTGTAAGSLLLWYMPPVTLAALIIVSNIYGGGFLSLTLNRFDFFYYISQTLPIMAGYLFLGYVSLFLSRCAVWKRPGLHIRTSAILGAVGLYILAYGVIHIPGFCWGHPFWCEVLWYLVHLGMAVLLGVCSGLEMGQLFFLPLLPPLIANIFSGPPPIYGIEARIPRSAARAWPVVCFFVGYSCMLAAFFIKRKLNKKA